MAGPEGVNKALSIISKVKNGAIKAGKFLVSGIGIIVLKIAIVVFILIFLYLLADTIFKGTLSTLLFGKAGAEGVDEYNMGSEFLQNLTNSGYDSLVNANQLMRYYALEYAVLMDEAEYLEVNGVYSLEKHNQGLVDWEDTEMFTRDKWDQLVARGFQSPNNYDSTFLNSVGITKPKQEITSGDHVNKVELTDGTFYYKPVMNTYTNQTSLIPYYRTIRTDHYLRYLFELDELESQTESVGSVYFDNHTWNSNQSFGGIPKDSGEIIDHQRNMAQVGNLYNSKQLRDPNTQALDNGTVGPVHRFEPDPSQYNNQEQATAFVAQHVNPTFFVKELNSYNGAALLDTDERYEYQNQPIDLDKDYEESDLFYYQKDLTITYDIPLRVLLDRFLPNASLLSSWRLLTTEPNEKTESGSVAEDLVNDIIDVYNDACLTGEDFEAQLWLLKDVGVNHTEVSEYSTAVELLDNGSAAGETTLEKYIDEGETNRQFTSYVPLFDSRGSDYESKINKEAEIASEEQFTGSFKDEIADDVRLAFTHYANTSKVTFDKNTINKVLNEVKAGVTESGTSDVDSVDDIIVFSTDENNNFYYYCRGVGDGATNNATINYHYGLSDGNKAEVKVSNTPVKHTEVRIGGAEQRHKAEIEECKVPFVRVSYKIENGLKSTAVIIHQGEDYFGYIIKDKEVAIYEGGNVDGGPFKGGYTNNYSFVEIESGELQSTLFWHWEYQNAQNSDDEKSFESWLVTDAFEGLSFKVNINGLNQPKYMAKMFEEPGPSYYMYDYYGNGTAKNPQRERDVHNAVAPEQDDKYDPYKIEGEIPDERIVEMILGETEGTYSRDQIFHKGNFAIVRSGDIYDYGFSGTVPSRKEGYEEGGQTAAIENAAMTEETANSEEVQRNPDAEVTTIDEPGETEITTQNYFSMKNTKYKTSDSIPLDLEASAERLREWQLSVLNSGYGSQLDHEQKPDAKPVLQTWENVVWYIYYNKFGLWSGEFGPVLTPLDVSQERLKSFADKFKYKPRQIPDYDEFGNLIGWHWNPLPGGDFGWNDDSPDCKWDINPEISVQFNAVYPTRVTVQAISQRVVDRHLPAWFVQSAKYWAGEKEFHNYQLIKGEFSNLDNYRYLCTRNDQAMGIKHIVSEYAKVNWRCNLFAPIFGSNREDNSGREGDIKLIMAEWEGVGDTGVGAADHAIRDLYNLIQYSKGVRNTDDNGRETSTWAYEPLKNPEGDTYINENSYTYMYVPDEIITYNELHSEEAFWLDRIISTRDDIIYDLSDSETVTSENRMRSRLPVFTWQVVDYNMYEETRESANVHKVYALWPFGDQYSRLAHAVASAAGEIDAESISNYNPSYHRGADLHGRLITAQIFRSIYGAATKNATRENINLIYGYGFFDYDTGEPAIKAVYRNGDAELVDKDGNALSYIDTSTLIERKESEGNSSYSKETAEQNKLYGVPEFNDVLTTYSDSDPNAGVKKGGTQVTLKLGRKTYTVNGSLAATYAYQAYRTALMLKDKTGAQTNKVLKRQLEREAQWSELRSVAPGVVVEMGGDSISGFWVQIRHNNDGGAAYDTFYCHMKRYPLVQVGEYVGAGTIIGYEGTTGRSTGFHLHMGMKGTYTATNRDNPVDYIYPFFAPFWYEEKAQEVLQENSEVFLDSEYFTPARTVYAYGQSGANVGRNSDYSFKMGNPTSPLFGNADNLMTIKDATDFKTPKYDPNITQTCEDIDYQGEGLHTNPDYSDAEFIEEVQKNSGRIHGSHKGFLVGGAGMSFNLGGATKAELWAALMELFGNPYAVAGVMGNIQAESSFNPASFNKKVHGRVYSGTAQDFIDYINTNGRSPDNDFAFGLCQWRKGRQDALIRVYVNGGYDSVTNVNCQLEHLANEMRGGYSNVYRKLQDYNTLVEIGRRSKAARGVTDPAQLAVIGASDVWLYDFEKPGHDHSVQRAGYSWAIYQEFAGGLYSN